MHWQNPPQAQHTGLGRTFTLIIALLALGIFGAIAEGVERQSALTDLDSRVAAEFSAHGSARPLVVDFFGLFTHMGGVSANCLLALLVAGVLLLRGQRQLALMAILLALGGGLIDFGLKELFRRPRPASPADWVTERNYSFPSGHSMGSVIGYGLLVYLLVLPLARRLRTRVAVLVGVALLVGLIGFSRVYLRAHYASDVFAGFAAGIVWLAICITVLNSLRQRTQLRDDPDLATARAGTEFLGLQLNREEVLSELSLPAKTL